jgi:predicted MPP superfamily phosphohydrolase
MLYAAAMRRLLVLAGMLALIGGALFGWGYHNARADPIVHQASVNLPAWPKGAAAVRVLLLSDLHYGNAVTDAARLSRIVAQANALSPDLILIPGDFVAGHDPIAAEASAAALVAPLGTLHAPLGVIATLGNHDQSTRPAVIRKALERAGITVLENEATQRGPLAIGGVGDIFTHHDDLPKTLAALRALSGARLVATHSPDLSPRLPRDVTLLLAGHTHCGQIVAPILGALAQASMPQYLCGVVREHDWTTIVTGGTGTSILPLRFNAPPDMWIITIGAAPPYCDDGTMSFCTSQAPPIKPRQPDVPVAKRSRSKASSATPESR